MRALRIVLKTLAWIIGLVLALLLIIIIAIQIPYVQNKALTWATPMIEDMLGGAEVRIDHINLKFFDAASVEGIFIGDKAGDTLLYAKSLSADIGAFSLFGGKIMLDRIALDGAIINAYQRAGDTAFNYQFIIDALTPDTVTVVDTTGPAFSVGLGLVDITNTRIRILDEVAKSDLNIRAGKLYADINTFNQETLAFDISEILVEAIEGSFIIDQLDPIERAVTGTALDTMSSGATVVHFPTAGFPLLIDKLSLKEINFSYSDANFSGPGQGLDAGNLEFINLNADAKNFAWDSTRLALDWQNLSFRERSGLVVDQLGFKLEMSDERLSLADFEFNTDVSKVLAKAELQYSSFNQLVVLNPSTRIEATFDNSYLAFSDLKLLAPTLEEAGLNLDANGSIYLDGSVSGTLQELQLRGVNLRLGQQTTLALNGTLFNALDPDNLRYDLAVDRITSSYVDLNRLTQGLGLPPELAKFGRFSFSGDISGDLQDFRGQNLVLSTNGRTGFRGDVVARNIDDPSRLYLDARVRQLRTSTQELSPFIPDSLGINAQALGDIDFSGIFRGTLTDFKLKGELNTDIGSSTQDLTATFNDDYTKGSYEGTLTLDSFNVGRLLRDSTIGKLSLDLKLKGDGIAFEDIVSDISGTVRSFTYNGYTYNNIFIDGNLDRQLFEGKLAIDDKNAKIDFKGLINLRDSLPDLQFVASIDTLALQPLGFYPTPLGISMSIVSNIRGSSADNLYGRMRLDSISIQDSVQVVLIDSLLFRAGDTTEGRYLVIESPILNAGVIGNYNAADLPALLTNYINDYFPVDEYINPIDAPADLAIEPTPQRVITDQSFDFYVHLSDPIDLAHLFDPALEKLDTMSFAGRFESKAKLLEGRLYMPGIEYDGITIDTVLLDLTSDVDAMLLALRTAGIDVAGQHIDLALADLTLGNDSLGLGVSAYLNRDSLLFRTALHATMDSDGRYVIRLNDLLEIAGQEWNVSNNNKIVYWANYLRITDLTFEKDDQYISIASDDASQDIDFAPLTVTIKDYQLSEVARLIQTEGFTLNGEVNGTVGVRDPGGNLFYEANITVDSLALNGGDVGTLVVNASSEGLANALSIDVRLNGEINDFVIAGQYGIADGSLDLDARMKALELRLLDPILTDVISKSEGILVADMDITGTIDAPDIDGYLGFENAATTYDLLGIRLGISDSRIEFSEKLIDFGKFIITDAEGREATLTGTIGHDYFSDFQLGLRLKSDAFRVLDTESAFDALYYGDAIVSADVRVGGSLEVPQVNVRASTKDGTDVYIQPLVSVNGINDEKWVIYANPLQYEQDSLLSLEDVYQANTLGLDLSMTLEVTQEAQLHIIIDPATGDALVARGNADISVQMSPDGDINVTGLYTLNQGSYQFSFAPGGFTVQQRNFSIRPGSYLQFVGDPLDTRFNITAVYETETTTYELIADELPGGPQSAEAIASQRRQPVRVLLSMEGNINEPKLSFDIVVPEAGGGVSSAVQQKLAQLRQTPNELYQQVFGILVFNSFIASDPTAGGGGVAGAGTSLAINSVSKLVTNQLNTLADNYLKGVNLNVGLDSYEDQYAVSGRTTVANVDLSKSFLNDRLTITLGTETNVGSSQRVGLAASTGGFQSSFTLTYTLTESGRYLLRVFRRPDYNILSTGGQYETGAGISYRKKFEKFFGK